MTPIKTTTAALALAAGLAALPVLAPTAALAVPPGGYGDLVEQVSPSVVFIEVTGQAQGAAAEGQMPFELPQQMPEEMRRHFEKMFPKGGEMPARQGLGSGFIISEDGRIVTNAHVVEGAETVTVKLSDGRRFEAEVLGADRATDIALLKIEADVALPPVAFGASGEMRVGDEVMAVGNPFGLGGSVSAGIVSALKRDINAGPFDDFIQTDAAINRGNSGGPLFNNAGEVIGVNTAILSPGGGSVGIGFAVPSDLVQEIVADLSDDGKVTRGWLGVQIRPMTPEVAEVLGFDAPRGAVIEAVSGDSPAEAAGLKKGDIILSFGGTAIDELRDLTRAVARTAPEKAAEITVLRKGKEVTLDVTVGLLKPEQA